MKAFNGLVVAVVLGLSLSTGCGGANGLLDGLFGNQDASPDLIPHLYKLETGAYDAKNPMNANDGCMIGDLSMLMYYLDNPKAMPGNITLSVVAGGMNVPIVQGVVNDNVGDLTKMAHKVVPMSSCEFDYSRKVHLVMTADDQFDGTYSEDDTNRKGCVMPAGDSCHTEVLLHFVKH